MKVLVTGSKGFVGKNLVEGLKTIRDKKDNTRDFKVDEIFEYHRGSSAEELERYCTEADFVFNLAGINRPKDQKEFMEGNFGFATDLLNLLKKHDNKAPVMISSSIQATLEGRYAGSEYGKSKLAGENLMFDYQEETGAKVLVYRFPNLFGKWCKPNYNSVIATFCHNIANDLDIQVNDRSAQIELLYIDDLLEEMYRALEGKETRANYIGAEAEISKDGKYCLVPGSHKTTLGEIVDILEQISNQPKTLVMPKIAEGSLEKKLYSTYLSYLPKEKTSFELKMNVDNRGSFTEVLRTLDHGQFSVNVSKPGITKGQHWHHSKWEFFIVVSGDAIIEMRKVGEDEVRRFEVSGEKIEAVHMLPGYTHNIINASNEKDLVTLMWANEPFDPNRPDTYFEEV